MQVFILQLFYLSIQNAMTVYLINISFCCDITNVTLLHWSCQFQIKYVFRLKTLLFFKFLLQFKEYNRALTWKQLKNLIQIIEQAGHSLVVSPFQASFIYLWYIKSVHCYCLYPSDPEVWTSNIRINTDCFKEVDLG